MTVTSCSVLQSPVVKVSESSLTVATAGLPEVMVTVTSLSGSVFSFTVNLAVWPSSIVRPEVLIAMLAVSLSLSLTATLAGVTVP